MIKPQRPPYAGSKVDAYKTKAQIDKLLKDYGCEGAQWTENFAENIMELRFLVEIEFNGRKQKLGIKLTPPLFKEKRRTWDVAKGRHVTEELPNLSQSMRVMYHYLKAKLAAVAWGVRPFEEEFLSDVIVNTEYGERRLVDVLKDKSPSMLGLEEKPAHAMAGPDVRIIEGYGDGNQ
jgi:hypothetical protein